MAYTNWKRNPHIIRRNRMERGSGKPPYNIVIGADVYAALLEESAIEVAELSNRVSDGFAANVNLEIG